MSNDYFSGVLKTDNNVISHQLNELKTTSQERFTEIENLKTRITVIQEDNKNIRQKSEDSLSKVKEKEVVCKELQDRLTEMQQKLHSDQIKVCLCGAPETSFYSSAPQAKDEIS